MCEVTRRFAFYSATATTVWKSFYENFPARATSGQAANEAMVRLIGPSIAVIDANREMWSFFLRFSRQGLPIAITRFKLLPRESSRHRRCGIGWKSLRSDLGFRA
jgi:hypothetical protein